MTSSTPRLRDQVQPGQYAGHAFIDGPELDALDRLVDGSLTTVADLERCEIALRALLLHTTCASFNPWAKPGAFLAAQRDLLADFEPPGLSFSSDDPSIPPGLLGDLMATNNAIQSYLSSLNPTGGGVVGFAFGLDDAVVSPNGGAQQLVSAPGLNAIAKDGFAVEYRANLVLAGFLGGAGIFAEDAPPLTTEGPTGPLLQRLDAWYGTRAPQQPTIVLPPLLAAVMRKASTRGDVPAVVRDLQVMFQPAVRNMHQSLVTLHDACAAGASPAAVQRLKTDVEAEVRRFDALTGDTQPGRPQRLRTAALVGATLVATAIEGGVGAASGLLGVITILDMLHAETPNLDVSITPSLAHSMYRAVSPARDLPGPALLVKHLDDRQLQALMLDQRRRA